MAGSTIGSKVTTGVTLSSTAGPRAYLSPLTVTRLGYVAPSNYEVAGISASIGSGYILNQGRILGGLGKLGAGGGNGTLGAEASASPPAVCSTAVRLPVAPAGLAVVVGAQADRAAMGSLSLGHW
jgi:hypothetical protein